MQRILTEWIRKIRTFSSEEWFVVVFGMSFLMGVWYAFPMVNTVSDVWVFGGGVLRAIEARTLLPGGDLAYGTVSFYQNYIAMVFALGVSFVLAGFDMSAVKELFILNPHYSLLIPRIVSALTAMIFLFTVYRFLRVQVQEFWWRIAIILLLFGNVITIFLTRSGKMWILSMMLVTLSFIFLYYSLIKERKQGKPGKYALFSVVSVALATANFAFAAIFFIAIPILFFSFPKTFVTIRQLFIISLVGLGVLVSFFVLNAENIFTQISGFLPSFLRPAEVSVVPAEGTLSLIESIRLKARHAVEAFPLFFLAILAVAMKGVRDRTLVFLSVIYGLLYFIALVFVFRTDHDIALNVRHVFPLAIFMTFLLAGFHAPRKFFIWGCIGVSGLLYVYTVWLMSVPTTYNNAYEYVIENFGHKEIVIEERIFEFTLPMNQASYRLFSDAACATTCQYRLSLQEDIDFRPIVITNETDVEKMATIQPDLVFSEREIVGCKTEASFRNQIPDNEVYDIDINLGRMLMPSFYHLSHLGKNLYLYEWKKCPVDVLDFYQAIK